MYLHVFLFSFFIWRGFLPMLGSSIQQWSIQELGCWSWVCSRRHPTRAGQPVKQRNVTKLSAVQM